MEHPMYLRCLCSIPHREASKISKEESLLNNTPTPKDDFESINSQAAHGHFHLFFQDGDCLCILTCTSNLEALLIEKRKLMIGFQLFGELAFPDSQ